MEKLDLTKPSEPEYTDDPAEKTRAEAEHWAKSYNNLGVAYDHVELECADLRAKEDDRLAKRRARDAKRKGKVL